MDMVSFQKRGNVPVTVLQLHGKLDGSNYMQLIEEAQKIYLTGVRALLIDLSNLAFLSSAGIAAIHKTALLFRGQKVTGDEPGWASFHAIDRDRNTGIQQHVKLLSPQPEVANILDITGFNTLFEIHSDLGKAVASFQ